MSPIRHIVYECLPGAYAGGVQKMVFELASAQRRTGADVEVWTVFFHPHGALDPVLFAGWSLKSLKKRLYHRFIGRPDLHAATGVFALTPLEAEQLTELGVSRHVHVIPNGIAPVAGASADAVRAFRAAHGIEPSARVLLFVGRIMPKKRLEDIIVAFAMLRVDFPDLVLAIAGNVVATRGCYMRAAAEAGALIECEQGAAPVADALRPILEDAALAARLRERARAYAASEHDWNQIAARMREAYALR
ncbi:MAG: hypothetical protein EBV31_10275 [Verrucomicrobia bacterium]|nr:hypothetical protein [Verrucomicrobiota bacterium]